MLWLSVVPSTTPPLPFLAREGGAALVAILIGVEVLAIFVTLILLAFV